MNNALLAVAVSLAVGGPSHAGERAPKHPAPIQCKQSVDEFLHDLAGSAKGLSVSQSLNPKQYATARATVKEHSKDHLDAPGDGAIIIAGDAGFALVFTKGNPAGDMKMCAFMGIPAEVVADILGVELPKAADKAVPNDGSHV